MKEKVFFKNKDIKMAGEIYYPVDFDKNKKYPAIVITHPGGGVKEQASALYGGKLAEKGFIALAFDASYQGESGGEPRFLEDPTSRVEDIRCAIDYLVTLPYIDENRIGAMGICAGGGYSINAAQTEYRIKAVAGISSWDVGDSARHGLRCSTVNNMKKVDQANELFPPLTVDDMKKMLDEVAKQRSREARGEERKYLGYVPNSLDEITEKTPVIQKEAYEYYRTPRASHPNSQNKYLFTSIDRLCAFSAFDNIETISPRPILLIVGSEADTIYFSKTAYNKAQQPKEMFKIQGATHIDLYDKSEYVNPVVEKLAEFFGKNL